MKTRLRSETQIILDLTGFLEMLLDSNRTRVHSNQIWIKLLWYPKQAEIYKLKNRKPIKPEPKSDWSPEYSTLLLTHHLNLIHKLIESNSQIDYKTNNFTYCPIKSKITTFTWLKEALTCPIVMSNGQKDVRLLTTAFYWKQ